MQYKPTRSLCATVAIAATLALGSTSYAQETAPVVAIPAAPAPVAAAPAAAPTIAVPPVTVQPTAPQPVAEAAPEPAARQAPAPRARAERAAPTPRQAAPAAAAPVAAVPAAAIAPAPAAPVAQTPIDAVTPAPVVEPAPVAPNADSGADSGLTGEEIGFLGLLAAIGLGGIAFLALRRRRPSLDDAEMVEAVEYAADPVAEPQPMLKPPVTLAATTVRAQPTYETPIAEKPAPVYAATDHAGLPDLIEPSVAPASRTEPVVLPAGEVPHGEERNALLDRMMNAEPDEANPFTSKKARRRRARLILQRMESDRGDDQGQPFDWRTYESSSTQRQREPELA